MGKVVISPHPIKTAQRIDVNGNVIDPVSKRIIARNESESMVPPEATPEPVPVPVAPPVASPLDIQEQIKQAEANLEALKAAKRAKIEEMEKQLNELKQQ